MILLGGALRAADAFSSAHWKSRSEMAGGTQGSMTTDSELWLKDKKVRIKTKAMGMDMNVVNTTIIGYHLAMCQSISEPHPEHLR